MTAIDLSQWANPTAAADHLRKVWGVEVAGRRWAFITDGKMLLAVRADPMPESNDKSFPLETMAKLLTHGPEIHRIRSELVLTWLADVDGSLPASKPCEACRGSRNVTCECDGCGHQHMTGCQACDMIGVECDERCDEGRVFGVVVNRVLFKRAAMALKIKPDEMIEISYVGKLKKHDPIKLSVGERWACVMPMRVTPVAQPELVLP